MQYKKKVSKCKIKKILRKKITDLGPSKSVIRGLLEPEPDLGIPPLRLLI
jgi:hypothetical protein